MCWSCLPGQIYLGVLNWSTWYGLPEQTGELTTWECLNRSNLPGQAEQLSNWECWTVLVYTNKQDIHYLGVETGLVYQDSLLPRSVELVWSTRTRRTDSYLGVLDWTTRTRITVSYLGVLNWSAKTSSGKTVSSSSFLHSASSQQSTNSHISYLSLRFHQLTLTLTLVKFFKLYDCLSYSYIADT